jgi:hypothetical protein
MKKIILVIAVTIFACSAKAQDSPDNTMLRNSPVVKYCAIEKDGKIMMLQNSKELMVDVTLENKTIIKTDGTILKPDGTKQVLKKGECVDNNGTLINPKGNDKNASPKQN